MAQDWSQLSGSRVSRRTLLKFSAGASAMWALGACSQSSSSGGGNPQRGGQLRVAWNLDKFTSMDPQLTVGADQMGLLINVCEGLTRLTPALDVEAALAESWDVSPDGRRYTFHLRRGVKWHNGDDFTAHDMVFTYQRGADPKLGSPNVGGIQYVSDVRATDDRTVVFELKQPFAPLLTVLTGMPGRIMSPVHEGALQEMGAEGYARKPLGTGPFRISEHEPGDHVTLTRFDQYWEKKYPLLDEVVVDLVPEPSTVQSALLSGDVDFVNILRPQSFAAVDSSANVQAITAPGPNWWGMWLNYNNPNAPFLADPRVRLAFAKAIDRDGLIKKAFFGQGDPAYGVFNPAVKWAYRDDKPRTLAYDPKRAKQLLSDADATGVSVQLMTEPGFKRTDEVIAEMLTQVGIDVTLDLVESSVYSQRGYTASDYQMMHSGSAADPDPDDSVYQYFHSAGDYNTFGYRSDRADALIDKERSAAGDRTARAQALAELEDHLIADVAAAFTFHSRDLLGMANSVHDAENIAGLRSFRTAWLD